MGIFSWSFRLRGSSDFDRGSIQGPGSGSAPDRLSLACGFLSLPLPPALRFVISGNLARQQGSCRMQMLRRLIERWLRVAGALHAGCRGRADRGDK